MKRKWEITHKSAAMSMKHIPDSWIDVSDIPELSDQQLSRMGRVGRPGTGWPRSSLPSSCHHACLVALRLMATKQGKPHQTLTPEL